MGKVSKIKLIIADNKIKFSALFCFINFKFLKIKTTNNAAYLVLIGSILLSYKKILKIKIE